MKLSVINVSLGSENSTCGHVSSDCAIAPVRHSKCCTFKLWSVIIFSYCPICSKRHTSIFAPVTCYSDNLCLGGGFFCLTQSVCCNSAGGVAYDLDGQCFAWWVSYIHSPIHICKLISSFFIVLLGCPSSDKVIIMVCKSYFQNYLTSFCYCSWRCKDQTRWNTSLVSAICNSVLNKWFEQNVSKIKHTMLRTVHGW